MIQFHDISTDTQSVYRLEAQERAVFFFCNRGGDITFELAGPGAEAHIFALFRLNEDAQLASHIYQKHQASDTRSSFTGRSILSDQARCDWKGSVVIESHADRSESHQEMRQLLLSPLVQALSFPSLEIHTDDVRCGHAATASAPDAEQLFFLQSRGLSEAAALSLISEGFLASLLEKMRNREVAIPTSLLNTSSIIL